MSHPVVIIGAGPTGLAAAAHAQSRGLTALVLEAGDAAGAAVREWGHVRLFSSWGELIDPTAEKLLANAGWQAPDRAGYPTGAEWVAGYLQPLADALDGTEQVTVSYGHRVAGVARAGRDVLVDGGRDTEPFAVHVTTPGGPQRLLASAVIDASGTWGTPNPLGTDGYPALGEAEHADRINYAIPDFTDPAVAARYAGKHVAVAGTGASAQNTLLGLARLADQHPGTRISWLVRRADLGNALGGGDNDQLAERGALGKRAQAVAESGLVRTVTGFRTVAVHDGDEGRLRLESVDGQVVDGVDEVVVVTGFRPDLSFLSEVRLDLDPVLQSPRQLAPLIDPNVHSCGTVYPHGAKELEQPEAGLLPRRDEVLRPRAVVPDADRVRADPQHRGRHRRRPRGRRPGGAGAARDRRLRRLRGLRRRRVRTDAASRRPSSPGRWSGRRCGHRVRAEAELRTARPAPRVVHRSAAARPDPPPDPEIWSWLCPSTHRRVPRPPARDAALDAAGRRRVTAALCLTEVTSWGVLFYAFPVLQQDIAADTGWATVHVAAAFTLGQVIAALAGIGVGRILDRRGPRWLMTGGSVLAVVSLLVVALGHEPGGVLGWLGAGRPGHERGALPAGVRCADPLARPR